MILKINAKCSDLFSATIEHNNGDVLLEYDGYVLDFMPNEHYGDYIELSIDTETGKIVDWPKNADKLIKQFIAKHNAKE